MLSDLIDILISFAGLTVGVWCFFFGIVGYRKTGLKHFLGWTAMGLIAAPSGLSLAIDFSSSLYMSDLLACLLGISLIPAGIGFRFRQRQLEKDAHLYPDKIARLYKISAIDALLFRFPNLRGQSEDRPDKKG